MVDLYPAPEKLSLAVLPTPLQPLDRLSAELGGARIWVKRDDLTHAAMSGNKLRKLEFVVADALQKNSDVLITCGGVQSNHCRATAIVCAQLGLRCHLILRGQQNRVLDGNTLLADLVGAKMTYLSRSEYCNNLSQAFTETAQLYRDQGLTPYLIPTGASDEVGLWGYYTMAFELAKDIKKLALNVSAVCCATGSGGTHAGLALGFLHQGAGFPVRGFAVCDDERYFVNKGNEDISAWYQRYFPDRKEQLPKLDVTDQYVGSGYGIAGPEIYQTIREVARLEGVILDPVYTGKAFYGMAQQIRQGIIPPESDVIFVHTGGLFGVYPHRTEFSQDQ